MIAKAENNVTINGIKVIAIQGEASRLKRFFISSFLVYKKTLASKAKVCHFHDPELIPVAILLRLRGKTVIYDVHEDLPRQILSKDWIHPLLRHLVSWTAACAEWVGSRLFFTAVVPATPTIADRFPRCKTVLIQNFPYLNELQAETIVSWSARSNNVVYVGGISEIRGVLDNIRTFEFVQNSNCRFVLVGPFKSPTLEQKCRNSTGWASVDYHSWLDRGEVRDVLAQAKVGLVLFHPEQNHINAQPNKLFEYMSAGLPVIASDFPLWRKIVDDCRCGLLVDPLQPEKIARAIDWLFDHPEKAEEMGKNGRRAIEEKYNWEQEEKKLFELYRQLTC